MVTYTNEQVLLQGTTKSLTNSQMWGSLDVQGEGSGYSSPPSVFIDAIDGHGSGAQASATLKIAEISVTSPGSGYTSEPTISFSGGNGSGASAEAIINNGQVTEIRVAEGGSGYTAQPTILITGGGGSGASAQPVMGIYGIITVTSGGSGYTVTPNVRISAPSPSGVTAKAYAQTDGNSVISIYLAGDVNVLKNSSYLTVKDTAKKVSSSAFLVTSKDNHDAPILTITEGLMIEKDLMVGGFVDSGQGALFLNYGLKGRPLLSTPPLISLMSSSIPYPFGETFPDPGPRGYEKGQLFNLTSGCTWSGTYYPAGKYMWNGSEWVIGNFTGKYDTLYLFKWDGITPAHLDVGDLTVHGSLHMSFLSFLESLENTGISLWKLILTGNGSAVGSMSASMNMARSMSGANAVASTSEVAEDPQLWIQSSNASIRLGEEDDVVNLYRATKTLNEETYTVLETDNDFIAPAIDANQLVINQDAHIVGSLYINELRRLSDGTLITPLTVDAYGYATLAGIRFGEGWGSIYRNTAGSNNIIEVGGAGVIVDGFVNCAAVSSTGDIGTGTALQINTDTRLYRLAWTPPNMNPTSVVQVQYYNGTNWVNGTIIAAAAATDYITSLSGGSIRLFDALRFHNGSAGVKLYDANNASGSNGQVLTINSSGYPVWTTPSSSNPFNQSLNTTDNAIFNSVKGTDGTGALKAGDEMTLAWDGTYSYIAAHNKHMYLGTSSGKDVIVQRSLRITDHPIWFTSGWSAHPDSDSSAAEISNDTGTYKTLMIVGNTSAGGSRSVSIWDKLTVNGTLTVTSQASANNFWINGSWLNSSSTLYIGGASGAAVTMYMNGNVNPISDNTYGLGSGSNRWAGIVAVNGYFSSINSSSGIVGNGIAVGCDPFGSLTYPYESIQLESYHNLRINFGTTQKFYFANSGTFEINNGNIQPASANVGNIGTNTLYWGSVWTNYLRYKNISTFDALDDLTLAKNYQTKTITEDGVDREVIDPESLSFLKADSEEPFFDNGKTTGFLLGCVKALVQRVEALEKQLKQTRTAA